MYFLGDQRMNLMRVISQRSLSAAVVTSGLLVRLTSLSFDSVNLPNVLRRDEKCSDRNEQPLALSFSSELRNDSSTADPARDRRIQISDGERELACAKACLVSNCQLFRFLCHPRSSRRMSCIWHTFQLVLTASTKLHTEYEKTGICSSTF